MVVVRACSIIQKASRPVSRILSGTAIHLGPPFPAVSCGLPEMVDAGDIVISVWPCSGRGLPAVFVSKNAVRSYRTVSPLPAVAGGLFSVALSTALRRPGVTRRPALRSPDFPPMPRGTGGRLADSHEIIAHFLTEKKFFAEIKLTGEVLRCFFSFRQHFGKHGNPVFDPGFG